MPNKILVEFEALCGLNATRTAHLLGIAYPTYAAYRNESRELPIYHERHVRNLSTHQALKKIIKEDSND